MLALGIVGCLALLSWYRTVQIARLASKAGIGKASLMVNQR